MAVVYVNARLDEAARAELSRALAAHQVRWGRPVDTLEVGDDDDAGLHEAEIAFGQPAAEALAHAPRLRWLQLSSAGWARYDRPALRSAWEARGVAVCNASGAYAVPVAEHALAMILALQRCLPEALDEQRGAQRWQYGPLRRSARVLRGERVLLLGYGGIARALVERLRPFGVELVGYRRRIRGDEEIAMVDATSLDDAWAAADHLVLLLPGGDETHHFVDAARLRKAKRGARLYNVGRGTTVDPDALVTALRDGVLDAAYLDVTEPEPLPPGHPLWTTPRVLVTPHSAGGRVDEALQLVRHFVHNLRRWERGEALVDRVV